MPDADDANLTRSHTSATREGSPNRSSGLRWFASEFLVVVAGILVALGLQAWWQDRQDSLRGEEFKRQILSDVRVTERTLRESITLDRAHITATELLAKALYAPEMPAPAHVLDLLKSYPGWFADPRPILGNVNALIQTGEIRLVKNPETRAAIITYASIMDGAWQDKAPQLARMLRANDLSLARLEAQGLPPLLASPSKAGTLEASQLTTYLPKYVAAWPLLRADEQFRTAQQWRILAYSNFLDYNAEMLSASSKLREHLERHMR